MEMKAIKYLCLSAAVFALTSCGGDKKLLMIRRTKKQHLKLIWTIPSLLT